jgi:quercetin dioxygenase-like cupin family protein
MLFCALLYLACMLSSAGHAADVETLLETSTTVLDQPIAYPTKSTPKITAVIVTLQPGEETGTHQHPIPLFGYILSGELTVVYAGNRTVHLKEGDPVIEAHDVWHDGHN